MGYHEGWAQPSGLLPGEAGFVTRPLDRERWAIAEERTAELIARIQPNRPSEERRNAVVQYVQGLIHKCFNCEVFTFGSVPLKTYLPDGDIDLTAFSMHQNLKDTWAKEVCNVLESEEKSEYAEFHVKEVHYIQAEVKIIKCLVENIVVDISFNQLGGLCTLCFLEQVDNLMGQSHLFKRSIILVKAWCYYESRILGAHHGLISTYALETLVLYIFNVFNNSFSGPLEVLYRFLAFFSNFDWENYCVSLRGPILLSSLPEMEEEPPRKDGGELPLNGLLDHNSKIYAVYPGGQENQGQSFVSKHFNVVDPLRPSNNLGRSVNKGNFFRIRSAFGFGARQLARILECPNECIISEIDQFFMNTWDRHGHGQRPDAPSPDLWHLQPARLDSGDNMYDNKGHGTFHNDDEENSGKPPGQAQIISDHMSLLSIQGDGIKGVQGHPGSLTGLLTHPAENNSLAIPLDQESLATTSGLSTVSRGGASKSRSNKIRHQQTSAWALDKSSKHIGEIGSVEKSQRGFKGDSSGGESEEKLRFHFARPRSSPELTSAPNETTSRGRRSRGEIIEAPKNQVASSRLDHNAVDRRRKNTSSHPSSSYTSKPMLASESLALRRSSSQENIGTDNFNETSNYSDSLSSTKLSQDASLSVQREEVTQADEIMETVVPSHHEGQDPINFMDFQRPQFVNRQTPQIHLPVNFASFQLPVPIGPPLLASVAYAPANLSAMGHTSLPLADTNWGPGGQLASFSSQQFPQSPAPSPVPRYVPNLGMGNHAHLEDPVTSDKLGASGSYHEEEEVQYDSSFWQKVEEHDTLLGPAGGLDMKGSRGYHVGQSEPHLADHERPTSPSGPPSASPAPYARGQKKFVKDIRGLPLEGQTDLTAHYSPVRFMDDNGVDLNLKAVPTSSYDSSSTRVSESTCTGAAGRVSKMPNEKRGRGRGNNNIEFSNSKQRETFLSSYRKSNSGWHGEPTVDCPIIGDEPGNQKLHSSGAANADSLNHGDRFSSSLHGNRSSIPPPASESMLPARMSVRNMGPISSALPHVQPTSMSGYDSGSAISSDSVIPGGNLSPVIMGQGPRQRAMDNGGVLPLTFFPTGPPFPIVVYNIPTDGVSSGDLSSTFDSMGSTDDSIDNQVDQPEPSLDTSSSYDLGECSEQADIFSGSNMDLGDEVNSDILHSDIASHWQNLQFGRYCQNPHLHRPVFNNYNQPPPLLVHPMFMQGYSPWDGPGRPLPAPTNMLTHLVSCYGHRIVPLTAFQPNSQYFSGPNGLHRGGTGTYLPNPRQAPYRDRQSSGSRGNRGNFGQDRNDHGDRDASWVYIPKNRGSGRGQNKYDGRNQNDKSNSRVERNSEGKGGERGYNSYRHDNIRRGSNQVHHAPFAPGNSSINTGNAMPHGSGGMPYGVYPLQAMNTNGNVPSIPGNGPAVPSVVMLYPYDHNMGFTPEPLEFGSLGPVQLGGSQDGRFSDGAARLNDGHYYEQKHNSYQTNLSPGHSPSDQPSSPKQHQRSSTQRSYQLKEEDFPPLSFRNQSGRGGSNSFNMGNNSNSSSSHYPAFLVTPSS